MANPLIQLPFVPYRDVYFDVNVNTESEAQVCDIFKSADQDAVLDQRRYLESKAESNPTVLSDPFYKFMIDILLKREQKMRASGEWQRVSPRVRRDVHEGLAAAMSEFRSVEGRPVVVQQANLSDQIFDTLGPIGSMLAGYYAAKAVLPKVM